jgi:hypothetical protein
VSIQNNFFLEKTSLRGFSKINTKFLRNNNLSVHEFEIFFEVCPVQGASSRIGLTCYRDKPEQKMQEKGKLNTA